MASEIQLFVAVVLYDDENEAVCFLSGLVRNVTHSCVLNIDGARLNKLVRTHVQLALDTSRGRPRSCVRVSTIMSYWTLWPWSLLMIKSLILILINPWNVLHFFNWCRIHHYCIEKNFIGEGIPQAMVTDNRSSFTSEKIASWHKGIWCRHKLAEPI